MLTILLAANASAMNAAAAPQALPVEPDAALKKQWEQRFRDADKDASRSLDRDEARSGLPKVLFRHFDDIDTDRDQHITPEELWAMHRREVAEREKRRAARTGPPR